MEISFFVFCFCFSNSSGIWHKIDVRITNYSFKWIPGSDCTERLGWSLLPVHQSQPVHEAPGGPASFVMRSCHDFWDTHKALKSLYISLRTRDPWITKQAGPCFLLVRKLSPDRCKSKLGSHSHTWITNSPKLSPM